MIPLSDRELVEFQLAFPWFIGTRLPDGRVLGHSGFMVEDDDLVIQAFKQKLRISAESTVLELGCAEGNRTVYLAPLVKKLTAVDVRPRNICGLLTRLYVYDIRNVRACLKDISVLGDGWGTFDAVYHGGVLYHLADPVAHMFSLAGLAPQLLLDTHYGTCELGLEPCPIA
jgi:hypothetical protein